MHILMLAAENDSLPGGKVGGLGDVIRDLPAAMAAAGHRVTVVTPAYGIYDSLPQAQALADLRVAFGGGVEEVGTYTVSLPAAGPAVTTIVLRHPLFAAGGAGRIYTDDGKGPFATDAHRFALASAAAAEALLQGVIAGVDVVHCHDWHTAAFLFLRRFDERYAALRDLPAVFTIHNLSLQGIRPLRGHWSSLEAWFPGVSYAADLIIDTRYHDCVNLMRAAINLADRVNTVSPGYAREITRPSDWSQGVAGGDGLESDLRRLSDAHSLVGILNGCDYAAKIPPAVTVTELWPLVERQLDHWAAAAPAPSHYFALRHVLRLRRRRRPVRPLFLSVSRLTYQKMGFLALDHGGQTVLDAILSRLGSGVYILLGSGDESYEALFTEHMRRHDNFLYLRGYAESLADTLYSSCDLFLMPSVFEPCGISQLLAMRAGMPCLVHRTGGLNDTVRDGRDGFSFGGQSLDEKLSNLVSAVDSALELYHRQPLEWQRIAANAASARFTWELAAGQYLESLYPPT